MVNDLISIGALVLTLSVVMVLVYMGWRRG
jgi:hypothetical protein